MRTGNATRIIAIIVAMAVTLLGVQGIFARHAVAEEPLTPTPPSLAYPYGDRTMVNKTCDIDGYYIVDRSGAVFRGRNLAPLTFKDGGKVNVGIPYAFDIAYHPDDGGYIFAIRGSTTRQNADYISEIAIISLEKHITKIVPLNFGKVDSVDHDALLAFNSLSRTADGKLLIGQNRSLQAWAVNIADLINHTSTKALKAAPVITSSLNLRVNGGNASDYTVLGSAGDFVAAADGGMWWLAIVKENQGDQLTRTRLIYLDPPNQNGVYESGVITGAVAANPANKTSTSQYYGLTIANNNFLVAASNTVRTAGATLRLPIIPTQLDPIDTIYWGEQYGNQGAAQYGAGSAQEGKIDCQNLITTVEYQDVNADFKVIKRESKEGNGGTPLRFAGPGECIDENGGSCEWGLVPGGEYAGELQGVSGDPAVGIVTGYNLNSDGLIHVIKLQKLKPILTVVKTGAVANKAPGEPATVGDTVNWQIVISNAGLVDLDNVRLKDVVDAPRSLGEFTCDNNDIVGDIGASLKGATGTRLGDVVTCTVSEVVSRDVVEGLLDSGSSSLVNSVSVAARHSGVSVPEVQAQASVDVVSGAGLFLEKSLAGTQGVFAEGDEVFFSFKVTNNGLVSVRGVEVDDPLLGGLGAVTCDVPEGGLKPGESMECVQDRAKPYLVTADDVAAGSFKNEAVAKGVAPGGGAVESLPASVTVSTGKPVLDVVKTADIKGKDPGALVVGGDTIIWKIVITNNGVLDVNNVRLIDVVDASRSLGKFTCDKPGVLTEDGISLEGASVNELGESVTCSAEETVDQSLVDRFAEDKQTLLKNEATVESKYKNSVLPSLKDDAEVNVANLTAITLEKTIKNPKLYYYLGEKVLYSFKVKNTGNLTIKNVSIVDKLLESDAVTCDVPEGGLKPGESMECVQDQAKPYLVTADDVAAGSFKNEAQATTPKIGGEDGELVSSPIADADAKATDTPILPPGGGGTGGNPSEPGGSGSGQDGHGGTAPSDGGSTAHPGDKTGASALSETGSDATELLTLAGALFIVGLVLTRRRTRRQ